MSHSSPSLPGEHAGIDFISLYTSKSDTPPHRHHGGAHGSSGRMSSSQQLTFSPSPGKTDHEHRTFCHRDNVDDCVAHLNSELTVLGFLTLYDSHSATFDIVKLVNVTHELIKRHQHSRRIREELEYRERRLQCDQNHMQITLDKYKVNLEHSNRIADQLHEKERQLINKNKVVTAKIESKKEEIKRLQNTIQYRDAQFKHEIKKRERELLKLKDKMHQLLSDKNQDKYGAMDILNTLQRSDGKRGTWKIGKQNKQEEEMYKLIILNYEEKQKELLLENRDLKHCVQHIEKDLTALVSNGSLDVSQESVEDIPVDSEEELSIESTSEATNSPNQLTNGHFEMPYELVSQKIEKVMKEVCKQVKDNMTKNEKECKQSIQPSVLEDLEQENSRYKRTCDKMAEELRNCKAIIEKQGDMIEQLQAAQTESKSHSRDTETMLEEQHALADERRLMYEQLAKFEEDKKHFAEAVIQFGMDRKTFKEEKSSFFQKEFMNITPFKDSVDSYKLQVTDKRVLPPTPGFMTLASRRNRKLPSTPELYHVLGLGDAENGQTGDGNHQSMKNRTAHGNSGISSKHSPSRVAEHMENIKMTLFQQTAGMAATTQKGYDAHTE